MPLSAMICSFNKIFSCVWYLFCIRASSIILKASISVGVRRLWSSWRMSSVAGAWSSMAFLIPPSLWVSMGSSLFSSIFISQASLPWSLEEGDDMMPGLDNPHREQPKTGTEDICVIRESKPPGGYIMNFYRPKYVLCTKMESGEHTRCPRGRGRALHPHGALVSFPDNFLFVYFSKYSKMKKYCH